jgi:hypothetical protein
MHIAECLEIGTASKGKTIDEAAINFKMATKFYRGGGQHPGHGSEEGKRDKRFLMIYFQSTEEYID